MVWKFNSKELLSKTLNSRINIIEARAVSNIVPKNGKYALEAKREGLEVIRRFLFSAKFNAEITN